MLTMLKSLEQHDDAVAGAFDYTAFNGEGLVLPDRLFDDDRARLERRYQGFVVRQHRELAGFAGERDGRGSTVEARLADRGYYQMKGIGMIGHIISLFVVAKSQNKASK